MRKRLFSVLLALCLCVGLLSVTAMAAPADEPEHWADNAVNTLNTLYSTNVFTIHDTDNMTEGNVKEVLAAIGHEDYTGLSEDALLTRSKACAILTDIFKIPVENSDNAAITYLYNQHIIKDVYKRQALRINRSAWLAPFSLCAAIE